jgi:hypothetical protein
MQVRAVLRVRCDLLRSPRQVGCEAASDQGVSAAGRRREPIGEPGSPASRQAAARNAYQSSGKAVAWPGLQVNVLTPGLRDARATSRAQCPADDPPIGVPVAVAAAEPGNPVGEFPDERWRIWSGRS